MTSETILGVIIGMAMIWSTFWFGFGVGRKQRPTSPVKDDSICSCTHSFSSHFKDSLDCNVTESRYDDKGREHIRLQCPCVNYDGVPPAHVFLRDV